MPLPDDRLGERACAAVILEPGVEAPGIAELQDFLKSEGLSKYSWPESIEIFEDFPRTAVAQGRQARPRQGDPGSRQRDGGRASMVVTFFERYFAALDGPDPHSSLQYVADDVEFVIQWAAGAGGRSTQILGGIEQLRAFIDAGDMSG